MSRRPNLLLKDFLNQELSLPTIAWETVPPGVNPAEAWEAFDENIEGWVPVWFPSGDQRTGISYCEFERAYHFDKSLKRILKAMNRWPLWGSAIQKKHAVGYALLQLFCEVRSLCPKV